MRTMSSDSVIWAIRNVARMVFSSAGDGADVSSWKVSSSCVTPSSMIAEASASLDSKW